MDTGRAVLVRAPVGPVGDSAPRFPAMLRSAGVEGTVVVDVMVDTMGRIVPGSLRRIQQTHELFVAEVRRVLPHWRFVPAHYAFAAGHARREKPAAALHRMTVSFRIVGDSAGLPACRRHAPYTTACVVAEKPRAVRDVFRRGMEGAPQRRVRARTQAP